MAMRKITKRICAVILVFAMLAGCVFVCPVELHAHAAAKIKLNTTKASMSVGDTKQLKVTGTDKKVTWSSSKKSVATVSKKGKVTAKKAGTATITAKVGKKRLTCKVTVKALEKIHLEWADQTEVLDVGKTYQICPSGHYSCGHKFSKCRPQIHNKTDKWGVVEVSKDGIVKVKKKGTATIKLKFDCDDHLGSCYIYITAKSPEVSISESEKLLTVGESFTLHMNGTKAVSFKSDNKDIASVSKTGVVTAKSAGIALISVKAKDGNTYTCTVTCNPTEEQVYECLMKVKEKYPTGTPWGTEDDNFHGYILNTNYAVSMEKFFNLSPRGWGRYFTEYGGILCSGFSCLLSNRAFGNLPVHGYKRSEVDNFESMLRVGDFFGSSSHDTIFLGFSEEGIDVAQGAFNNEVVWAGDDWHGSTTSGTIPPWKIEAHHYDSIMTRYAAEAYTDDYYNYSRYGMDEYPNEYRKFVDE